MRSRYVMTVTACLIASAAMSGCAVKQKLDERFTPAPTKVTVEATVAASGAPIDGTLVKGFPDSVPMWPGAKVTKTKVTKTPQGKSYTTVVTTIDPYADVLAGVGEGFKQGGWTVESIDASTPEMKVTVLTISNADYEGIVTLSQSTGKPVRIEYVITPKK